MGDAGAKHDEALDGHHPGARSRAGRSHQLLQRRDLAEELARGSGRTADNHRLGFDVRHHARLPADPGSASNSHVLGKTRLTAHHDAVTDLDRPGDADLCCDGTVSADAHAVRDLHLVVQTCAGADDCIAQCAPIDGRIRANLNIVFNDHAAELGYCLEAIGGNSEAKTFLPDSRAWIYINPCPEQRMADAGVRSNPAVGLQYTAPFPIYAPAPILQPEPTSAPGSITA